MGAAVRLVIPTLQVDAPVTSIFSSGQVLEPPDDPASVGWWIASSPPGSASGTTVLVGHVDTAANGPGALYRLTELGSGDQVVVDTADGSTVRYEVDSRSFFAKTRPLPPDLFRTTGPATLILITCGGDFDTASGSYAENTVVTAQLV
jgi:sortase (surface protein transpeptidase)